MVTAGLLVGALFYLRTHMENIRERIRGGGRHRRLSAADFTVMVTGVPETWGSDEVRPFRGQAQR